MGRNGSGVRRASANSIEITFTYRGVRCRERIGLKPTPANLKSAERHRAAILDAIAKGTFNYPATFPDSPRAAQFATIKGEVITIERYLEGWLGRAKAHTKVSTWRDYVRTVRNVLIPMFGHLTLIELRRSHIRDWGASTKHSNKRIANILSPLRVALQEAMGDDLIQVNPLYGWTYERKEAPRPTDEIDPFTPEEQAAILAVLNSGGRNLIQFAFWTGMRTSELVALEWGDVDWLAQTVRITKAHTQAATHAKAATEGTKTKAGTRSIKLLPPAFAALQAQKAESILHPSGRVFLNPRTGEPWAGDQAIRKTLWTHALKRAGVRYRYPYQTRHTFASVMLSAGEDPRWLATYLGHSDLQMIFRRYGRWMPVVNPNAGMKGAAFFVETGK